MICLTTMVLTSCAPLTAAAVDPARPTQSATVPAATTERQTAGNCPLTVPIKDEPPKDPNADRFGFGTYYVNDDRTMWVRAQDWKVGGGHKVIWIRPQGTELVVTGHRLDAEGPPLRADIPCCYLTGFQVTGLIFPADGCWEVTARAGESELRFITQVKPASRLATNGSCESLADVVKQSDAIVVGRITETENDRRYAWHTIIPMGIWKPDRNVVGDWFSLLQDLQSEPALEKNKTYLLFLQYGHWKLLCAQRSVVEKQGKQAIPVGNDPLWAGGTMSDLKTEVQRLLEVP